jgi:predicted transcriptional regulator
MPTKTISDDSRLSDVQLHLIEDFVADYNCIDQFLRRALDLEDNVPFASLLQRYSRQNPRWRDADFLVTAAKLRNLISHSKTGPYGYPAVPSPELAKNLKECLTRLTKPLLVIPRLERQVEKVSSRDSLATVLKLIRQRDYSQFPVYENKRYFGLLTENGITRWLAYQVATNLSLVELEDTCVNEVIKNEEKRMNCIFVAKDAQMDNVVGEFASNEFLEAVLITTTGKDSEPLVGIATRWDIVRITESTS